MLRNLTNTKIQLTQHTHNKDIFVMLIKYNLYIQYKANYILQGTVFS